MTRLIRTASLFLLSAFLCALAAASAGPGLAGRWTGEIKILDTESGATISQPVTLTLEEKSGAISGTIGREGEQEAVPIRHATFQDGKLRFDATSGETTGPVKFDLTLAGDRIEGEVQGAVDTEDFHGKFVATRIRN